MKVKRFLDASKKGLTWGSGRGRLFPMWKRCKYCRLDYENDNPEWLRWNYKDSEYCSQDCEIADEYWQRIEECEEI